MSGDQPDDQVPMVYNLTVLRLARKTVPGAKYIGRPGPHGNPYVLGKDGTREEVMAKHIDYLWDSPDYVAWLREDLKGRDLLCHCHPLPCHGHTLRDLARGEPLPERNQEILDRCWARGDVKVAPKNMALEPAARPREPDPQGDLFEI